MTPRTKDDVMPAEENVFGAIHQFKLRVLPRRSAINKKNRAKLKIVHTSGARSFQRMKALLKNLESDEINPTLLYKKAHTNKDGIWTLEDARENFEKMERYSCSTSQRESIHISGDFH
ncbi:hypothetical protein CJ030_MR1G007854 [Morella rubra]|uniref:Uncharacterized protein n=1 Tax=Morella rubra TaxID=262757 RepID=A0A6A1WNX6_9ROSI|nr:hypothetical protein CJ030_MR1G007854 [Morella rubra]